MANESICSRSRREEDGRLEILKFKWGAQPPPPAPPPAVVVVYGIVTANWIGRVARGRRGDGIDIIPGSLLTYE